MQQRKIVITGLGIVSPLGNDTESTWQNLLNQKSGIASIQSFDATGFPTHIAAEVKNFDPKTAFPQQRLRKYTNKFTDFALAAAEQAFVDAGIKPTASDAERWGVVTGAGMMTAEFEYWQRFAPQFAPEGEVDLAKLGKESSEFIRVADFARSVCNTGLSLLAQAYDIRGYANAVHTACASSGQALGLALQVMRRGDADCMLAGGFDSMINPVGLSDFCLLGAVSTDNENPQGASRPFDLTRNGFVLGEGSAFLILETLEHAKQRGAYIYAELAGEGNSMSAYRITDSHPSGDGAMQAIRDALKEANVSPNEVSYVNAHGTSTKMNDLSETNAIKTVLGEHAYNIPVSSTKSQTGHLIAAAGAIEAAFSALAIKHQIAPMTANLTTPDPDCNLDFVTDGPRDCEVNVVLSNSFGFGGSNSSLVFKRPE